MWKVRVFCCCIWTACLLNITCALTGHEGQNMTFRITYPPEYEENSKYFGRSDTYSFEKLVQSDESNRWVRRGRFALFDDTSAHVFTAAILALTAEDSGSYLFGVDVRLAPDPETEIQLTVTRGKPKMLPTTQSLTTTTTTREIVHSTNNPLNVTTQMSESHLWLVAILILVCVCVLLLVFSLLKWTNTCRISVSVSYRTRQTSTRVNDEYVKMSTLVHSNTRVGVANKSAAVDDFPRSKNTEAARDTDVDQIYTDMNATFVQESVYESIDPNVGLKTETSLIASSSGLVLQ